MITDQGGRFELLQFLVWRSVNKIGVEPNKTDPQHQPSRPRQPERIDGGQKQEPDRTGRAREGERECQSQADNSPDGVQTLLSLYSYHRILPMLRVSIQ
jgi:hypothetical protein